MGGSARQYNNMYNKNKVGLAGSLVCRCHDCAKSRESQHGSSVWKAARRVAQRIRSRAAGEWRENTAPPDLAVMSLTGFLPNQPTVKRSDALTAANRHCGERCVQSTRESEKVGTHGDGTTKCRRVGAVNQEDNAIKKTRLHGANINNAGGRDEFP